LHVNFFAGTLQEVISTGAKIKNLPGQPVR